MHKCCYAKSMSELCKYKCLYCICICICIPQGISKTRIIIIIIVRKTSIQSKAHQEQS